MHLGRETGDENRKALLKTENLSALSGWDCKEIMRMNVNESLGRIRLQ